MTGDGGADDISVSGSTVVFELADGRTQEYTVGPEDLGIARYRTEQIPGGNASDNRTTFLALLDDHAPTALRDLVCANAAAGMYCYGTATTLKKGYERSRELLEAGRVRDTFNRYRDQGSALAGMVASPP